MINKKIQIYREIGDETGFVEYVQHMGSDLTIVNSARVSFGKHKQHIDDKDKKLIKYLIQHKHTSTLEHNILTLRFKVPLFVRSQHHRHRTWSYNEISRRYTDENLEFYDPKVFRTQHSSNRQASNLDRINPDIEVTHPESTTTYKVLATKRVMNHNWDCVALFDDLIDAGICREQARGVLPQSLYTEYYGTCNLNNLIKFIKLRTHEGAQWEIQQVAKAIQLIAKEIWPITMNALESQK